MFTCIHYQIHIIGLLTIYLQLQNSDSFFAFNTSSSSSSLPHLWLWGCCHVDEPPPPLPVLCIFWARTNCFHVFLDAVQPPPLWSASLSLSWHPHLHGSPSNIVILPALNMTIPSQPCLSAPLSHFCCSQSLPNFFIFHSVFP